MRRFSPLFLMIPWTLLCLTGAGMLSGFDLQAPAFAVGSVLAFLPLLIYIALRRPLGLPFALYAILAEFDNLLPPGPMGTIAKLSGFLLLVVIFVKLLYGKRFTKSGYELLAWFLYFTWTAASLIWTIDFGGGIKELQQYVSLFLLYALLSVSTADATDIRTATLAVSSAGVMVGLFELASYHSAALNSTTSVLRATLSASDTNNVVDPNQLGSSLQVPLALLLVIMFRERNIFLKLCYLLGCCIILGGLLATASRSGIIALGVGFLFLLLRSRHRLQLGVITASALSLSLFIPTVWARFGDQTSGQFGGRLPIWHVAWAAFRDHWLIGQGIGSRFMAYDQALREAFQEPLYYHRDVTCHNIFLCSGVQFGIIGVLLLFAAWWLQFRSLKNIPPNNPLYDLRLALEAGTIALFIESCTLDTLTFKYLWIAFSLTAIVRNAYLRSPPYA
jgi:O-antigen ligase